MAHLTEKAIQELKYIPYILLNTLYILQTFDNLGTSIIEFYFKYCLTNNNKV